MIDDLNSVSARTINKIKETYSLLEIIPQNIQIIDSLVK